MGNRLKAFIGPIAIVSEFPVLANIFTVIHSELAVTLHTESAAIVRMAVS